MKPSVRDILGETVPGMPIYVALMEELYCRPRGGLIDDRRLSS
jgi:hypothetical protein